MKPIFTLFLAFVTISTFAQKDFQGKATYMSKRTMDMSRFDKMPEQQKKQMMARFKNVLEKTYTLTFNKTESTFKENVKLEAPGSSGPSWAISNGQGSTYKNVGDKEMIEDVEMFSKRFLVTEEMEMPQWEMGTETKKIGNYTCYKATMVKEDTSIDWGSMFGRGANKAKDSTKVKEEDVKTLLITAWYSPQIPVSAGPAEHWGLPGLILEINAGRTTMLCTELVINPENEIEIKKPTKGKEVSREEYNKIIKVKTEEMKERFQSRGRGRS
ncbi:MULTISPECIES: GLPGLI family protein [unclassified Polaribacter]|uniref:GLPGLI family protein n=1 Tax=unclassified Polaribacter TaxID=196858 RepID=UPI0011BEE76F|nr:MULTISPECIES: GLPGLI family protein [unclassified Polaribacter]TXD51376.1 GLPGLI family protein [Polaribacter sp. IC063]TXD62319.1 GLPGLI family protein [Polaribacter sp. IC066]